MDLHELRTHYEAEGIDIDSLAEDPISQLEAWLDAAIQAGIPEANAMVLSTITDDGPAARVVLLRAIEAEGLVFYTNQQSAKAQQIEADNRAAATFHWQPLHRQVRVQGTLSKVSGDVADAYFASRPRGSQIGAWASPQSEPIPSRADLDALVADVTARFDGQDVLRPPHWGGYLLTPTMVEFWQGQPSRLHDRIQFTQSEDNTWHRQRLAP